VENERDVVVEERLSAVEDSIDGTMDELMYKQAFKSHPYRWPVIGWMKDIKAITSQKGGGVLQTLLCAQQRGARHRGEHRSGPHPGSDREALRRHSHRRPAAGRSRAAGARAGRRGAHDADAAGARRSPGDRLCAPGLADRDRAAYEVAGELLAGGPSSRLYRTLVVDKEWASSVHADVAPTRDPGLYGVWVQMTKGHAAEQAEKVIVDAVTAIAAQPVSGAELAKSIARLETELWERLSSSHGRAEALGEFETAGGGFQNLFTHAAALKSVTAEDVRRVAAAYLATGARSVVIVRPKGQSRS
jgi:zinc protease